MPYWVGHPYGDITNHRVHSSKLRETHWDMPGGKLLRFVGMAECGVEVFRTIEPWGSRRGKSCNECLKSE